MTINVAQNENQTIVEVEGRLDTVTAPDLEKQLSSYMQANGVDLVLDCEKMEYVSSAGLRIILTLHKMLTSKGGKFTLRNLNKEVRNVFDMTGFSRILNIE
jgi:anti-anti-sigma factor